MTKLNQNAFTNPCVERICPCVGCVPLRIHRRHRTKTWAVFTLLWLGMAVDVSGLEISISYFDGFENRPDAVAAMEQAAAMWEAVLSDPVVVQIDVREVPLVFAQAGTFLEYEFYA
jgi:hypothetical protein